MFNQGRNHHVAVLPHANANPLRGLVQPLLTALAVLIMVVMPAPHASAHDVVIHSTPADEAVVSEFPHQISLEFSGIPQGSFNTVAISNADTGEVIYSAQPTLNEQFVSLEIPESINPGEGSYIIGFQITSSDGHATRGKTTFSVVDGAEDPDAAASANATEENSEDTTQTTAAEPQDQQGSTTLMLILGAVVVIAVVAFIALANKRKR